MSDSEFGKRLQEWQDKARKKAEEVNEKLDLRGRMDEGIRAAGEVTRKMGNAVSSGIDAAREQVGQFQPPKDISKDISEVNDKVKDKVKQATAQATETVKQASSQAHDSIKEHTANLRDGVKAAEQQANEFFGNAKDYYKFASGAAEAGARSASLTFSLSKVIVQAKEWIMENPGKTTIVTLSLAAGARVGAIFPGLDVAILGAGGAGNWFFHSAVAQYGLRRLTENYADYLKSQEVLINEGKLSEAERGRIEFQRNALKYVGAPLLGAFSIAAGSALMYEAFTGGVVTGLPISIIVGGNPLLNSIWLFGNGLVCFHNGYKFFMIALAGEAEVERIVNEVKGFLPAAITG